MQQKMNSVRFEPAKLILVGTRITYQASGDALQQQRLWGRMYLSPRSGVNHVKSHLRTFSVGELWATDEQARDLSDV